MENDSIKVIKLKGAENWEMWKFQIRVLLKSNKVLNIVNGISTISPAPIPVQGVDGAEAQNAAAQIEYQRSLTDWEDKDANAQKCIITSLDKKPTFHVMNCETSKEMWDKLHAIYEGKNDTNMHLLQQKWFSLAYDSKDDIAMHISKVEDLCFKLRAIGENISDNMLMTKMLMTVPSSYKHFITAWESTNQTERTVENLMSRLMIEEKRLSKKDDFQETALAANSVKKDSFRRESKNSKNSGYKANASKNCGFENDSDKSCWHCGKPGHKKQDCWHYKPSKRQYSKNSNFKKNNSNRNKQKEDSDSDALIGDYLLSANSNANQAEVWFLDSGAAWHMSEREEWLNYRIYQKTLYLFV